MCCIVWFEELSWKSGIYCKFRKEKHYRNVSPAGRTFPDLNYIAGILNLSSSFLPREKQIEAFEMLAFPLDFLKWFSLFYRFIGNMPNVSQCASCVCGVVIHNGRIRDFLREERVTMSSNFGCDLCKWGSWQSILWRSIDDGPVRFSPIFTKWLDLFWCFSSHIFWFFVLWKQLPLPAPNTYYNTTCLLMVVLSSTHDGPPHIRVLHCCFDAFKCKVPSCVLLENVYVRQSWSTRFLVSMYWWLENHLENRLLTFEAVAGKLNPP